MKRRTKRYDEGGDVNEEFARPIKSTEDARSEIAEAPVKKSFKEAFAEARKSGDKVFEWEGKKYTTELAKPKVSKPIEEEKPEPKVEKRSMTTGEVLVASNRNKPTGLRSALEGTAKKLGFKSGGSVSSASKRADGIAQRGKTRGRVL